MSDHDVISKRPALWESRMTDTAGTSRGWVNVSCQIRAFGPSGTYLNRQWTAIKNKLLPIATIVFQFAGSNETDYHPDREVAPGKLEGEMKKPP